MGVTFRVALACAGLLVGLPACGTSSDSGLATGGGGAGGDAGGDAGGKGGGEPQPCHTNAVDLELTLLEEGVADSQVIPVVYEGVEGYLAIDTGSPWTFVFGEPGGPEYIEHVGDVTIGCERYPVSALSLEAIGPEPFNGKLIIGIVGMDFFSEVPTEIDYPGRRVVRHLGGEVPSEDLTEVPVTWVGERVIVDAALDQQPVRLIYDAGSPHTIWVGVDGLPGDVPVELGTADGGVFTVYEGTAALDFADDVGLTIPVQRAPTFPYLDEELAELHADGLLGATGLGFRRVVFELGQQRLWLGSRTKP